MSDETKIELPMKLLITPHQEKVLELINGAPTTRNTPNGHTESQTVKISGHLDGDKIVVDQMDVVFLHRWMDCREGGGG